MNILSGVVEPDAGEMRIDAASVRFADPRAAQAAGVATIFQELDLVPSLDVTANLFLGRELTRAGGGGGGGSGGGERAPSRSPGVEIDVDALAELSVGWRNVAIVKALTTPAHPGDDGRPPR
jgi:ribose transport system ATP-binding protein